MVKTCVEDHEIIGGTPFQKASIHINIVPHNGGAVSAGSEGHTPDSQALPDQRYCWQSEKLMAEQQWSNNEQQQQQQHHLDFRQHPHQCQSCRLQEDTRRLWHQMSLQTDTAYLLPHFKTDKTLVLITTCTPPVKRSSLHYIKWKQKSETSLFSMLDVRKSQRPYRPNQTEMSLLALRNHMLNMWLDGQNTSSLLLLFTKDCVLLWLREHPHSEEFPPTSYHLEKLQTTSCSSLFVSLMQKSFQIFLNGFHQQNFWTFH